MGEYQEYIKKLDAEIRDGLGLIIPEGKVFASLTVTGFVKLSDLWTARDIYQHRVGNGYSTYITSIGIKRKLTYLWEYLTRKGA